MRLTDKDKFMKALDFLLYELHYPYDPPPFNDWTEEQKETADFFIMHIRNMMKHAQETKAIPIEWIERYGKENWLDYGTEYNAITEMLKEWEKENESNKTE